MTGSRRTVAMAPPCSGRMKLDSSVSTALTSHNASTAAPNKTHPLLIPYKLYSVDLLHFWGQPLSCCREGHDTSSADAFARHRYDQMPQMQAGATAAEHG